METHGGIVMRHLKRFFAYFCALICILAIFPVTAIADEATLPSVDVADAVYFYHIDSKTLIHSKNINTVLPAGSTTKIMAGLIAVEALADRQNERVSITSDMVAASAGYRLYIKAGDVIAVRDLLYAALCGSYNDAFDVLAYAVSGSIEAFVELMNQKAKEVGAADTRYTDPSGISDTSVTTAEDLAKIAQAAYQNERYMEIVSTVKYSFGGSIKLDAKIFYNRNALLASNQTTLYYNPLCKGLNAGETPRAGSCVVTVADNGKERYLTVVLGAPEIDLEAEKAGNAYTVTNSLIDWVYDTYTYMEIISPETVICMLPVTVSDLTSEVEVRTKDSLMYYLPKGVEIGKEITYSVRLIKTTVEAPVTEGEMVGYVAVLYKGTRIGTLPLYTAGAAERSSFIGSLLNLKNLTQNRVFVAGAIFFIAVLLGWIVTEYILYRRRHHKWDKYFSSTMTPSADALKPKTKTEHTQKQNEKLPRN